MKIEKGRTRVVLVFDKIVIKIARIKLIKAIEIAAHWIKYKNFWFCIRKFTYNNDLSAHYALFKGISENWLERTFYKKTRNPFLVPTYFSLFGLLNIQKREFPVKKDQKGIMWSQMLDITNRECEGDNHHFQNYKNFCFLNGKLKMIDYGSKRSHEVIKRYGIAMHYNIQC